ncbi:sirohydrochlorin chelatase [Gordonia phthalatica]|uniref:Cobalamin biosynthesis protein CbiX n=1 Tax=Gordonia phthalatica TaxID=1136941 RepID=A0A0N9NBR3_9ACTN|nr:CbiX/SirB N-terminal domain-containing protein [Gordonia phthalatica]ALG84454.1 cobalamin biosynthesis protein CbiX [Gordonia phthalatica]
MSVLLVAHGTRDPRGVELSYRLADEVGRHLEEHVAVGFVDVVGPTPDEVLGDLPDGPVTVLPAFLTRGHHARVDLPGRLASAGRPVLLAEALGPSPELVRALMIRLAEAGTTRTDAVVLAAAGSSDPSAHVDVERTAALLSKATRQPVCIAFASTSARSPYPSVPGAVAALRRHRPRRRIAVASYLLTDGLFQRRLDESGADVVARPLGSATPVIELACARIAAARRADRPAAVTDRRRPADIRA